MLNLNLHTGRIGVINGNRYQIFDEVGTGKAYARVTELLPTKTDNVSKDRRAELDALELVHVDGPAGVRGYYTPCDKLETPVAKAAA